MVIEVARDRHKAGTVMSQKHRWKLLAREMTKGGAPVAVGQGSQSQAWTRGMVGHTRRGANNRWGFPYYFLKICTRLDIFLKFLQ